MQTKLSNENSKMTKGLPSVDNRNTLNDLKGSDWIKLTKSVWYQRGLGNGHPHTEIEKLHPAPFAYQNIADLIQFFTKKGESVLDPFLGVASTLKACVITQRFGTGIELVDEWVKASKKRLKTEFSKADAEWVRNQTIIKGDAREKIRNLQKESFSLVVTSPPYWKILNKIPDQKVKSERIRNGLATNYSDNPKDLANIESYDEFLRELTKVFGDCYRVLKSKGHLSVVVSDFRNNSHYTPYHADIIHWLTNPDLNSVVMQKGEEFQYHLKGITILVQNNKKLYPYGYPFAYVPNIHHQYILIFQKY